MSEADVSDLPQAVAVAVKASQKAVAERPYKVGVQELFDAYRGWSISEGHRADMKLRDFNAALIRLH
jgi:hypothetical protein